MLLRQLNHTADVTHSHAAVACGSWTLYDTHMLLWQLKNTTSVPHMHLNTVRLLTSHTCCCQWVAGEIHYVLHMLLWQIDKHKTHAVLAGIRNRITD